MVGGRRMKRESPPTEVLVSLERVRVQFGSLVAVRALSFDLRGGDLLGLVGPNGAGKTTCFYMIVGLVRPNRGRIIFQGEDVTEMPMYKRARLGMGYLSQEPSVFRKMTVEDNIMAILETLDLTRQERLERLGHLLDSLGLDQLAKQKAITLSGGERRRLEITRALVTSPSFIMLDEPFSGVDPIAVHDVQKIIAQLRDMGLGILITDHSVRETLAIVDRAYLICEGKVLCEGASDFLINDEQAKEVYLGPQFTV